VRAHFNAFVTSGVAIVGAGIIATPSLITAPPADILVRADANTSHAVNLAADADALQLQEQFDALLAATDLIERIQQAVGYIIREGFGSGFDPHEPADDPIDGTFRLIEGFGASAVRTARGAALLPLGVIAALQAVAEGGDPAEALAQFIRQVIDGPGWAVNPILYALRDTLIEPLGGDPGFFADVQFGLAQAGTALGDVIVALLGLDDSDVIGRIQEAVDRIFKDGFGSGFEGHRPAEDVVDGFFRLTEGFGAAAVRTVYGAALLPLGLIDVAATVVDGGDTRAALADFITQTVHGPSWAINPVLFALRDALIEPLGGKTGVFADVQNRLQSASKDVGAAIVSLLGLDAAAAEGNSTGSQNVLRTAGERNEPGQAGAMRFAQDGPTALPGGGETLVVESPAADGLKQEQPDKPKIEHRKVEKRELRTGLLPTPVDLGTHRQPQRAQTPVELQQKPGGVKVDRNHKRFTKFTTHESGSPQGASSEAPSSPDRSNDKPTTKK